MHKTLCKLLTFGLLGIGLTACDGGQEDKIKITRTDMVLIPAGEFIMGSDRVDDSNMKQRYGFIKPLYLDEHPRHKVTLPAFAIEKNEVSNAQYKQFVRATGRRDPFGWTQNGYNLIEKRLRATDVDSLRWIATEYFRLDMDTRVMDKPALIDAMLKRQRQLDPLPVADVSFYDAMDYCAWIGRRLPTEPEWEKAARGTDGREFPWGNDWDPDLLNTGDDSDHEEGIAPVGSYQQSRSPWGVYDMAGNVWEWVDSWYQAYPGSDYQSEAFGRKNRVIRGGGGGIGHYAISQVFRAAARHYAEPGMTSADVGFRCAGEAAAATAVSASAVDPGPAP